MSGRVDFADLLIGLNASGQFKLCATNASFEKPTEFPFLRNGPSVRTHEAVCDPPSKHRHLARSARSATDDLVSHIAEVPRRIAAIISKKGRSEAAFPVEKPMSNRPFDFFAFRRPLHAD
jgi:hypothetical protein